MKYRMYQDNPSVSQMYERISFSESGGRERHCPNRINRLNLKTKGKRNCE